MRNDLQKRRRFNEAAGKFPATGRKKEGNPWKQVYPRIVEFSADASGKRQSYDETMFDEVKRLSRKMQLD